MGVRLHAEAHIVKHHDEIVRLDEIKNGLHSFREIESFDPQVGKREARTHPER